MRKLALALVIAAGFLAAQSASAITHVDYQIHGTSCTSITNGQTPQYNRYGVNAPGTVPIKVTCPLILPTENYTYAYLLIHGYNRSSTEHLSCTIASTDYVGNNLFEATAELPENEPTWQLDAVSISPSYPSGILAVICHLPARTSSGYSHLTSIFLTLGY